MILTEKEASTKRCQESFPAAHGVSLAGAAYPSSWSYPPPPMHGGAGMTATAVQTAPLNCIGSACMAWRWRRGSMYVPDGPGNFTEIEGKGEYSASHGYCGKAGKP